VGARYWRRAPEINPNHGTKTDRQPVGATRARTRPAALPGDGL